MKPITDKETILKYPKTPPGYKKAILYLKPKKNIYAIVIDDKDRTQYLYTKEYHHKKRYSKFKDMKNSVKKTNRLIKICSNNIKTETHTKTKLIQLIILLMWECNFRIGNPKYKKLYNSTGTITIEKKHINIDNSNNSINISFVGKKGMLNTCSIYNNNHLYKEILKLKNGKHNMIFTYKTDEGTYKTITYNDVLNYFNVHGLHPKDMRTIHANILFLQNIKKYYPKMRESITSNTKVKRFINEIADKVSKQLHHTRAICKKDYLHPNFIIDNLKELETLYNDINNTGNVSTFFNNFINKQS